ncbi:MAG: hypothetical protein WBW74_07540 [Xanthobacteraceae bacterium]
MLISRCVFNSKNPSALFEPAADLCLVHRQPGELRLANEALTAAMDRLSVIASRRSLQLLSTPRALDAAGLRHGTPTISDHPAMPAGVKRADFNRMVMGSSLS